MPVYQVACTQCRHAFPSMVMAGARLPETWTCPKCGAVARPDGVLAEDPLGRPGGGCACCG